MNSNIIGKRIEELRNSRKMSQEELGSVIGVKRAAINKYERGTVTNIPKDKVEALADFFGVAPSYLYGWDEGGSIDVATDDFTADPVTNNIRKIIAEYKKNFTQINKEERYKWEAVGCYRRNWDIEAENFAQMYAEAFKEASNLLAANKIHLFYKQDFINYRGRCTDTDELYSEVIAQYICEHIDSFIDGIKAITRVASYKTESHIGEFNPDSRRVEEITAMKMFNFCKAGGRYDFIGEIIDYQTPLKNKSSDEVGKVDLLAYDGSCLRLLELKKSDSTETMLRCVMEGFTYGCCGLSADADGQQYPANRRSYRSGIQERI